MKLTKKQREWLRDVKARIINDYKRMQSPKGVPLPVEGYKTWESWRLADLCEKLGGVKCKP